MDTFREVLRGLESLANETSTNGKVALLKEFTKYGVFKEVLKAALEVHRNYHITELPKVPIKNVVVENTEDIFAQLELLSSQTGATFEDKKNLAELAAANLFTWTIVSRIIKKDLRCGASAKLVNKACHGLIKEWPYMRCSSHSEKNMNRIKYPALIEEKADGTHVDVVVRKGEVSFISRKGRPMNFFDELDSYFLNIVLEEDDLVFIGEAVVMDDEGGGVLDRKTGNGIINKAIKNTITEDEAANIILTLWDVIPYQDFITGYCTIPHYKRFEKLKELFFEKSFFVRVIEHEMVSSREEATTFYKEIRASGGEGAIIKNAKGIFKNHTSPDQVKMKAEYDAEFKIIDWMPGKEGTKYENDLGTISVTSSDGKVVSWVGSGFSDQQRKGGFKNGIIGKIGTIRFESIIKRKGKEEYALYLPRFVEIREDKDKADDLPYILELTEES